MGIRRDDVLSELRRRGRPALSAKALLQRLGGQRGQLRTLRRLLRELEAEGLVERLEGRYRLRREDGLLEGTLAGLPGGRAQVRTEDGRTLRVGDAGEAREGDRVLVKPRGAGGGAGGADVVRVLATRREEWVGILSREPSGGIVTPYRDDAHWGLRVGRSDLGGARDGDVVVAVPRPGRGRAGEPTARIVEVLGPPGEPEADFRAVVWRRRLPVAFPAEVLAEAEAPEPGLSREERARRVDLTDRFFLTIDPATARDHDDAVCVETRGGAGAGSHRLWVAIADVAYYVPEGSALDREALRRGNSVYFPDRAIPMLPERLSGDLCSLRTDVERPVLCAELEVDGRGEVVRRSFYPAVIRSRAGLAYEQAAEVMEGRGDGGLPPEGVAQLRAFAEVARRLERRRFAAGSIDFDLPSAEIVLGDAGHPVDIVREPRTVAHRAIEEAMLAANRAVAETLAAARVPALYRIHEPPAPADLEELEELLGAFGLLERRRGRRSAEPLAPRDLARALQKVADRPEEHLVNTVVLRSMRQARYAVRSQGHFALAFDLYCHFTSPIRRYADLVVHRALRDLLAADEGARRRAEARGEGLDLVATRVSQRERVAEAAEREMVDLVKCAFMAERVGEEYDGTITGVARHGLYVTLDPFFVEGLVHVSTLKGYAVLDERAHALVVRGTRERFRLGDRVRVLVDAVDRAKAWINFALLRRLRRPQSEAADRLSSSAARRSQSR